MKKIQVLSLFLLLACGQIYGGANPDLAFVLAYKNINVLNKAIAAGNDDTQANKVLDAMDEFINFDIEQAAALKASQDGILFKGKPVDPAQVAAKNAELQKRIKTLNDNISKFKKGGVVAWEEKKAHNRNKEKNKKQKQLHANLAALSEQDSINNLREQNALAIEAAIEYYIATFGQCYVQQGKMYGSSIVISSDQDQQLAITINEYDRLMATLQKAANQFPSVMITLDMIDSDQDQEASISDVASYISNMPASSGSWAMFALKAAVGIGATIAASAVAYNLYQGKEWNSSAAYDDAMSTQAGQKAQALVNQAKIAGDKAYNDVINSSYGKSAQEKAQYAQAAAEKAVNDVMNSSAAQSIENAFTKTMNAMGYQTPAQNNATAAQLAAQKQLDAAQNAAQVAAAQAAVDAANQAAAQAAVDAANQAAAYEASSNVSWDNADQAYDQYFA